MSTQWGQDPYGSSQEPYGAQDPYASSDLDDAPGTGGDPYAASPLSEPGFSGDFGEARPGALHDGAAQYGAPQFGQNPYSASPAYMAVAMAPPSSGLGIAGFIVGLLGLTLCGTIVSPIGLVLSILGMRETSAGASSPKGGRGLTIAGLVLSIIGSIGLLFLIAYVVLMIVLAGVAAGSGY